MKLGILLVAYGCGNLRGASALRAVQAAAEERFRLPVRWAFTSEAMRLRLASSRTKSDSVYKALMRMSYERYTHIAVQPLHLIPGMEYGAVAEDCRAMTNTGRLSVCLGLPLLSSGDHDNSVTRSSHALLRHISPLRSSEEHVIYMAHGSRHECDILYRHLGEHVGRLDHRVHIACMISRSSAASAPSSGIISIPDGLDILLPEIVHSLSETKKIWLLPLLSVVGRHTLEDMAGNAPSSWKTRLSKAGFDCIAELRGLADDPLFIQLWLDRLESSLLSLGYSPQPSGLPCRLPAHLVKITS